MIYLSAVHLSPHNINRYSSAFRHSVLSATLTTREMDLYPENIPFKFVTHTHMLKYGIKVITPSKKMGMSAWGAVC